MPDGSIGFSVVHAPFVAVVGRNALEPGCKLMAIDSRTEDGPNQFVVSVGMVQWVVWSAETGGANASKNWVVIPGLLSCT